MAHLHCNFFSQALSGNTDIHLIIPTPSTEEWPRNPGNYFHEGAAFPVLYLLHGTYADSSEWLRLTNIQRYAQAARLMVVMPSGGNSFYQDMHNGPQYFTYLTEELPMYVKALFPASKAREDTFIGGLSMGAYGALNLSIRRPDLYGKAVALSGGMNFLPMIDPGDPKAPWPWKAILPPPFDGKGTGLDDEPILRKHAREGVKLPKFYLAVGTEDFLYSSCQQTRLLMQELNLDLTYREGPGGHDWDFWDEYIRLAIRWLCLKESGA